jgi:hypothetical protein
MMTSPRIPEKNKRSGVHYAVTIDGVELPVVDVTHPAFTLSVSDAEQQALVKRFMREKQFLVMLAKKAPKLLRRLLLRIAFPNSILARDIQDSDGTFLSGMTTYLLKLGPDNLGSAYAGPVDRKIAATLAATTFRLRLQDIARLLADALAPMLADGARKPIQLLNIAGGPALDSLNALLLLQRERPAALEGRRIVVSVLDRDRNGPAFGAHALTAWLAKGAPLHGLDVTFRHVHYDWRHAEGLRPVLDEARADDARMVGSSEGGLFEYGSDEEIVNNLTRLREWTPDDFVMVGSVTRADEPMQHLRRLSTAALHPRGLAAFRELAQGAGFDVARAIERPFCDQVTLTRIRKGSRDARSSG